MKNDKSKSVTEKYSNTCNENITSKLKEIS